MLIGNNFLYIKGFSIHFANAFAHIPSCEVDIVISARYHFKFLKHKVLANAVTFILPKSKALIPFWQIPLPNLYNFLFNFFLQQQLTLYSFPHNHTSTKLFVQNDANHSI